MSWLPEPIGEEVRRELGRFGPAGSMAELVAAWPRAVGGPIAANAWPARVARDGTLLVHASSSAWAFELGQREADVRGRLAALVTAEACPPRLRFVVGPLPEPAVEIVPEASRTVPEASAGLRAEGERIAAEIDDPGLREAVARAVAAALATGLGRR